MSPPSELLNKALALPTDQRAAFARSLLLSLESAPLEDSPEEVDRLWSEEIDARIERANVGLSAESDWRTAIERVRASLDKSEP